MIFNEHDRDRSVRIELLLIEIIFLLRHLVKSELPIALRIHQRGEEMITGVQVGGNGTFKESFVPANAALPPGATIVITWTVDDKLVTLAPSADGTSVVATVDPADTATTFNLTATGNSAALPSPITSGPVSVPILPLPPPLPTALSVDQTA